MVALNAILEMKCRKNITIGRTVIQNGFKKGVFMWDKILFFGGVCVFCGMVLSGLHWFDCSKYDLYQYDDDEDLNINGGVK